MGIIMSVERYDPEVESKTKYHKAYMVSYIEGVMRRVNAYDFDFVDKQVTTPQHISDFKNKLLK